MLEHFPQGARSGYAPGAYGELMTITSFTIRLGAVAAFIGGAAYLAGCASSADSSMGATPGGAQDEALANEKIELGEVPKAADITVEGMLASQDLPLDSPACNKPLCISSAYGIAPTLDNQESAVFVQMGFDSGVNAATFKRSPLNLSVVVDRSGSMAGEKLSAVKTALSKLIAQLDAKDRLSIVLFDDQVDVLLPSTLVTDKASISARISDIYERGSTNLAAGLKEGFTQVTKYSNQVGVSDRVIVLTDAIANTGSTDTESFIAQANTAAKSDIGLTVFGVGTDLNQELVLAISKLRGGNYAYLADAERISTVFDQDFDYLVTPLAYNLKFNLTPAAGFSVRNVYGFPSWTTASTAVEIDVATVFLSRGHGAIVARMQPSGAWPSGSTPLAGLTLSYEPADGTANQSDVFQTVYDGANPLGSDTLFYSQIGVRRTVAYVNAAIGMKQACTLYWNGNKSDATTLLDRTESLLTDEAAATQDSNLNVEAARVTKLRNNMQGGSSGYNSSGDTSVDPVGPLACNLGRTSAHSIGGWLVFAFAAGMLGLRTRRRTLAPSRAH